MTRQRTTDHRYATLDVAGTYAGCSKHTIRRRIADGSLTGYRFGPRAIRVDLNEIDEILRPIPTIGRPA